MLLIWPEGVASAMKSHDLLEHVLETLRVQVHCTTEEINEHHVSHQLQQILLDLLQSLAFAGNLLSQNTMSSRIVSLLASVCIVHMYLYIASTCLHHHFQVLYVSF